MRADEVGRGQRTPPLLQVPKRGAWVWCCRASPPPHLLPCMTPFFPRLVSSRKPCVLSPTVGRGPPPKGQSLPSSGGEGSLAQPDLRTAPGFLAEFPLGRGEGQGP